MIDRLFLATLTFALLAGATLAMGADWLAPTCAARAAAASTPIVRLETVVVTGRRATVLAAAERAEARPAP